MKYFGTFSLPLLLLCVTIEGDLQAKGGNHVTFNEALVEIRHFDRNAPPSRIFGPSEVFNQGGLPPGGAAIADGTDSIMTVFMILVGAGGLTALMLLRRMLTADKQKEGDDKKEQKGISPHVEVK
jgi:hypothetical protein